MKASEILEKAAELVDTGWVKNQAVKVHKDGSRSYCMSGAMEKAQTNKKSNYVVCAGPAGPRYYVLDVLGDWPGFGGSCASIIQFNDDKKTKKQEVIDVLLHAAAYAKSEGN